MATAKPYTDIDWCPSERLVDGIPAVHALRNGRAHADHVALARIDVVLPSNQLTCVH